MIEELCDVREKGQAAAEEKENKCAEYVLDSQWSVFAALVRSATPRVFWAYKASHNLCSDFLRLFVYKKRNGMS